MAINENISIMSHYFNGIKKYLPLVLKTIHHKTFIDVGITNKVRLNIQLRRRRLKRPKQHLKTKRLVIYLTTAIDDLTQCSYRAFIRQYRPC